MRITLWAWWKQNLVKTLERHRERDVQRDRWVSVYRVWAVRQLSQYNCPNSHSVCCQKHKSYIKLNAHVGNGGMTLNCINIIGKDSHMWLSHLIDHKICIVHWTKNVRVSVRFFCFNFLMLIVKLLKMTKKAAVIKYKILVLLSGSWKCQG